jgi:hypothetical protein
MTGTVVVRADLKKLSSFANRTFDLIFNTSELSAESLGALGACLHIAGTLAFKIGDFTDEELLDLPEVKPEFANSKSPSERLRNVLFVLHKQQGGMPEDFEAWRIQKMEQIIEFYKAKLEPNE